MLRKRGLQVVLLINVYEVTIAQLLNTSCHIYHTPYKNILTYIMCLCLFLDIAVGQLHSAKINEQPVLVSTSSDYLNAWGFCYQCQRAPCLSEHSTWQMLACDKQFFFNITGKVHRGYRFGCQHDVDWWGDFALVSEIKHCLRGWVGLRSHQKKKSIKPH